MDEADVATPQGLPSVGRTARHGSFFTNTKLCGTDASAMTFSLAINPESSDGTEPFPGEWASRPRRH